MKPHVAEALAEVVYRCACSWVGADPDIGPGRKTKAPTCPACWSHDRKRVVVTPEIPVHTLATVDDMGEGRCRWVCSCKERGILVGDLSTTEGKVFLTGDARARNAHGWHALIAAARDLAAAGGAS